MKDDDTLHEEKAGHTNAFNGTNKEVPRSTGGVQVTKKRSSGRGLYITAIVLGVIIVILLALYVFLALMYKRPTHTSTAPRTAITRISKGWTSAGESAILYPNIKYILSD